MKSIVTNESERPDATLMATTTKRRKKREDFNQLKTRGVLPVRLEYAIKKK